MNEYVKAAVVQNAQHNLTQNKLRVQHILFWWAKQVKRATVRTLNTLDSDWIYLLTHLFHFAVELSENRDNGSSSLHSTLCKLNWAPTCPACPCCLVYSGLCPGGLSHCWSRAFSWTLLLLLRSSWATLSCVCLYCCRDVELIADVVLSCSCLCCFRPAACCLSAAQCLRTNTVHPQ